MPRARGGELGQLARFALVGASNLVLDLLVFNLLWAVLGHRPGLPLAVANGTAYAVATAAGYLANRFWAFGREGPLLAYLFVYATTGCMAAVGLPLLAALAAHRPGASVLLVNVVKVAFTALLGGLNYAALRLMVFRRGSRTVALVPQRGRPVHSGATGRTRDAS